MLASDPGVRDVGVDVGFSPSPETLRAPDLSVGEMPDLPGWVQGAPPLAVEYADTCQDEEELQVKMQELFAAGTRYIWVVRLNGPRRVEVHQPGAKLRIANAGEQLEAPGILANPVPVEALWDREAGRQVTFRNLLQRQGYANLEEVRAQGELQGLRKAVVAVLLGRGLGVGEDLRTVLDQCGDPAILEAVLGQAANASAADILAILRT